ncbi:ATP-dependent RNA helicase mak5 [Aspergillus californicus]
MGQKRQRDQKGSGPQSKKQKQTGKPNGAAEKKPEQKAPVAIDDLDWKEVSLPDRLDDFEGFFGLEEIEGVEIIRPQGKGELRFQAAAGKPGKSILKTNALESKASEDNDEWSGFSDDDESADKGDDSATKPEPEAPTLNGKKEEKSEKNKKKKEKKDKKESNAKEAKDKDTKKKPKEQKEKAGAKSQQSISSGLSFATLEDEADDDGVDVSAWEPIGLSPEIITSISKNKFSTPTAVQQTCIPQILDGHDVVGKASTGSGKTLAFGLPILEHYLEQERQARKDNNKESKKEKVPIALILSPTRELAHQLQKHLYNIISNAPGVDARMALVTGGLSVQKQQRFLAHADIVIGTPGRVWEVLSTGQGLIKRMQGIKFLVVDEADRLLSEGHFKEVEDILGSLDRVEDGVLPDEEDTPKEAAHPGSERQTLVFSATFHRDLQQKLAGKRKWTGADLMSKQESMEYLLKKLNFREEKPKFIDMNPVSQMAEGLKEGIIECAAMEKDLFLYTLLLYHPKHRTLVFANSISAVRRITKFLQNLQLPALGLHSNMIQKARLRSVERFSSPTAEPGTILVATDVAARGLDIKGIEFVVHYQAPRTADSYVHRSGRTARAGASGKSVIICAPEEMVGVIRLAAKVHANSANGRKLPLESLEIDRRVVARIRQRVVVAAQITDANIAKEKVTTEDNWLRSKADELGVEYDSEEFEQGGGFGRGRGRGRAERDRQQSNVSKAELAGLRAELKELLSERVNVGVSERYITSGRVDIEALLRGEGNDSFLGQVDPLGF